MPHDLFTTERALNAANLLPLHQQYGGPVWVYEAETISARISQLRRFDTVRFAQKACSNIHLLRLMRSHGAKVDSVSLGEIERALLAGFQPGTASHDIVFTADLLDELTLARVVELGIPVNAGSADMLAQLGARSPGHEVWLRVNPGFGHGHSQKPIPAVKTANTGFGMKSCRRPRRLSVATACGLSAYICTLVRVWITPISRRSATPWCSRSSPADWISRPFPRAADYRYLTVRVRRRLIPITTLACGMRPAGGLARILGIRWRLK
ncbi:Diaminopimelate decarboxylase [Sodalis praecaptivus]